MAKSPLAMKYSGGTAPKGIPGVSLGSDGKKGSTPPKIMKGAREAGAMWKKPGNIKQQGKNAKDMSSGQSNPTKGSQSDRVRYKQSVQPEQYSNLGPQKTKFVC